MNQVYSKAERRKSDRFPVLLEASVSVDNGVINCVIFDISAGGAKLQLKGAVVHLEDGQVKLIKLNIPGFGDFDGQIVWTDDEYIGIKFHESHKTMVKLVLENGANKAS